jgi:5'-nucleotidase
MRFLLTNDDGIDAPGLRALARAVEGLGEILVIAPEEEQSGCSHATTTGSPLKLEARSADWYALNGTPADCVRVALHRFGGRFDMVIAGINSGGNLGVDVFHSGTVAAVREGLIHGVPGIAVSRYRSRTLDAADWECSAGWARPVLAELLAKPLEPGVMWNVNLPCLPSEAPRPEARQCDLDISPLGVDFREEDGLLHYCGEYRKRPREAGRDVDVCFGGRIAVTRLALGA